MENQRYWQEGLDWKRIFLLWGKKLWLLAAAGLAGAVLGGGIYLAVCVLPAANREYETVSKVYLNFNCEPEDFNELSYNGYTWNDLMATDPILNTTMENLPPEIGRETVIGATKAEILSDIRLLTITITADRPELAAQIMEATQASLVHLGETDELFESIEIYSTTEPEQIVWDNRTVRAMITGAVIALLTAFLAAAFYYVMDDSVYVAEDVKRRYGILAMGILTKKSGRDVEREDGVRNRGDEESHGRTGFEKEFLANYCYLCRGMKKVAVVSVDSTEDGEEAAKRIEQLMEEASLLEEANLSEKGERAVEGRGEDGLDADRQKKKDGAAAGNGKEPICVALGMPEEDGDVYRRLRDAGGVILAVRFGGKNGKRIERLLGNLENQDCRVVGAVIVDGNENFLRMYYGERH